MLSQEKLNEFWQKYHIPTQDVDEAFPYANPSDAARSLITAHDWMGTFTEQLIQIANETKIARKDFTRKQSTRSRLHKEIISQNTPIPSWASKNRDAFDTFVWSVATPDQKTNLGQIESDLEDLQENLDDLTSDEEVCRTVIKTITTSTELAIQYINWMKLEARGNV